MMRCAAGEAHAAEELAGWMTQYAPRLEIFVAPATLQIPIFMVSLYYKVYYGLVYFHPKSKNFSRFSVTSNF